MYRTTADCPINCPYLGLNPNITYPYCKLGLAVMVPYIDYVIIEDEKEYAMKITAKERERNIRLAEAKLSFTKKLNKVCEKYDLTIIEQLQLLLEAAQTRNRWLQDASDIDENVACVINEDAAETLFKMYNADGPLKLSFAQFGYLVTKRECDNEISWESIHVAAQKVTEPHRLAFSIGEDYPYIGIAMADCLMPLGADEWFTYNDDAFQQIVENGGTL